MKRLPLVVLVLALAGMAAFAVFQADWGDFERAPVGRERVLWQIAGNADADFLARTDQPVYLRFLQGLAGPDPRDVISARHLLRGILVPGLALLVWFLLRRRTGPWSATAGAIAVGISAPTLLLAGSLEPGGLAALFVLLGLVLLDGAERPLPLALGALPLALATWLVPELGWATAAVLAVVLLGKNRRSHAAVFAGVFLVAVVGTGRLVGSERILPRVNGVEVYQGHRTEHRGGDPLRGDQDPGRWWTTADYQAHASREKGRSLDEGAVSTYWLGRAGSDILRAPHKEILRTGVKTLGALQSTPVPRALSAEYLAERAEGSGLAFGLWAGRILLALGAAGLWLGRRRLGPAGVAALGGGLLAVWWTTLQGDTRGVLVCLLAGGFGLWLDGVLRRPRAALVPSLAALGLFLALPLVGAVPGLGRGPLDEFQLGVLYQQEGRGTAAMREFDRALREDETLPYPRMALGDLLASDQVLDEATREYERVREANPELLRPLLRLSQLYQQQEAWREMIVVNEALTRLDPTDAEYRNNLGTAYLSAGFFQRAEESFRRSLELDPGYDIARRNLDGMREAGLAADSEAGGDASPEQVMAQLRERRFDDARATLDVLFAERGSQDPQLRFLEGTLLLETGHGDSAVARFEELRPQFGENPFFLHNLAASYARTGHPLEALRLWSDLARRNPGNQVFQQSLAQVQLDLRAVAARARVAGDRETAIGVWEALVEAVPERPDYADSLAALRGAP